MKKFNLLDIIIICAIILGLGGFLLVKFGKHQTANNVIEERSPIEFDATFTAQPITAKEPLFKVGDNAFITIRNVPYTELKITNFKISPWKTTVYDTTKNVFAINDPSRERIYNLNVTLKDDALITKDGAVIGGNKIKIGLPITIEGFKYRLTGIVSDVRVKNKQ